MFEKSRCIDNRFIGLELIIDNWFRIDNRFRIESLTSESESNREVPRDSHPYSLPSLISGTVHIDVFTLTPLRVVLSSQGLCALTRLCVHESSHQQAKLGESQTKPL